MTEAVILKNFEEPEFNRREILRYAGCKGEPQDILSIVEECIAQVKGKLSYRLCYSRFPVSREGGLLNLGFAYTDSSGLKKNLEGCDQIILFAATIGLEMDRLIARYGRLSPTKGLIFQAIGAERIESLCNLFNVQIDMEAKEQGLVTKPRFSPGYGDLPLDMQREIVNVLNCQKYIGLSLTDSLLMTPSKSVTAIIGLSGGDVVNPESKCGSCDCKDCSFRSD